jgi:hypothetical protein
MDSLGVIGLRLDGLRAGGIRDGIGGSEVRMRYVVLVLVLSAGCTGGTLDRVPGQDLADQIVWHGLYGEKGAPPEVEWFHTESGYLPSGGPHGLTLPGIKVQCGIVPTTCPAGVYSVEPFECSLSGSSYAHELMHYRTYLRTGDVDAGHWRGDWELADSVAFQALIDARM